MRSIEIFRFSVWTYIRPDENGWMIDGVMNSSFNDACPIVNFSESAQ